jgi:hypothetical protein
LFEFVDKEDVFWTAQLLSDKVIVFKPEIQSVLFINSMRALWCWQRTNKGPHDSFQSLHQLDRKCELGRAARGLKYQKDSEI